MSEQKQQSQKNVISAFWIFTVLVIVVIAFGFGLYFNTYSSKKNKSTPTETEVSNGFKDEKSELQTKAHEISISKAECGYYLPSSKVAKYTADNLIDGNLKTAWAVNLDSPIYDCDALFGPIFTVVNCHTVSKVEIVNGYGKDEASFFNNTRAAWITIYREDYMVEEFPNESDIIYRGKLKDTVQPQSLVVSPNFDNSKPTNKIGLIFSIQNSDGYYFGRKWNDLCISEFKVYGNSIGTDRLESNSKQRQIEQVKINQEKDRIDRMRKQIVGTYEFYVHIPNYDQIETGFTYGKGFTKDRRQVGTIDGIEYMVVHPDMRVSILQPGNRKKYVGEVKEVLDGVFTVACSNRDGKFGRGYTLYKSGRKIGTEGNNYGGYGVFVVDINNRRIYKTISEYKGSDIADTEHLMYDSFSSNVKSSNTTEWERNYYDQYKNRYND